MSEPLSAARLEFFLQIQPLADVQKPRGDDGSLSRDFHITLRLVEPQCGQVVTCDVQAHALLTRFPGEVFSRRKQAPRYTLAPEGGGDHEPLDVSLRGVGGVSRVGEQRRRPDRPRDAEVTGESAPQPAGEDVFPRGPGPDADAAGDFCIRVPFDHQGSHLARGVLEGDPLLHDLERAVHPPAEDGPELVQEPFDDEGGYSLLVIRPCQAYGKLLGLHRAILPESRVSADEPPAHDLDRNQSQRAGEDKDPGYVDEYPHRGTRG